MRNLDQLLKNLEARGELKKKLGKTSDCLHTVDVMQYFNGELSDCQKEKYESHLQKCSDCNTAAETYKRYQDR